ncbi:MAG: DUF5652 family protein [Candidatus Pacearchaeota archaeon]
MVYELGLTEIAQQAGISAWILVVLILWTAFWKLFGLWKSARNNHVVWFMIIALVNTVGILPIIYIFGFSDMDLGKTHQSRNKSSDSKSKKSESKKKSS